MQLLASRQSRQCSLNAWHCAVEHSACRMRACSHLMTVGVTGRRSARGLLAEAIAVDDKRPKVKRVGLSSAQRHSMHILEDLLDFFHLYFCAGFRANACVLTASGWDWILAESRSAHAGRSAKASHSCCAQKGSLGQVC